MALAVAETLNPNKPVMFSRPIYIRVICEIGKVVKFGGLYINVFVKLLFW